jgi:GNAT superfamily N-acetyltransferase
LGETIRVDIVTVQGGAEARRNGEVAGRLVGELRVEEVRGRHVWSGLGDHFAAEPELYRDLYLVAGAAWLEQGATSHYVVVPAAEPVLWAWLGLAFAIEQVHAERPLTDVSQPSPPEGFTIRQGGPDDLDAAARLAPIITEHQIEPPVWSGLARPSDAQFRENMREALADPEATWFLAERDGEPLGLLLLWADPGEPISLDVAATLPEARGLGVGTALTAHALWWARQEGHERMKADWRIANLLASRFWPRRGFEPTAYRMVRYVRP